MPEKNLFKCDQKRVILIIVQFGTFEFMNATFSQKKKEKKNKLCMQSMQDL